jgi:hypothetical protein
MNPRVKSVNAADHFHLEIIFENEEKREFDVAPYLEKGIFKELKDESYFRRVKVSMGTIEWPHGQDFCPDMLYEQSKVLA